MSDPFDITNAVIRDLPHVLVTRQAAGEGSTQCTYRKLFKPEGLRAADYWLARENQFLLEFAAKGLKHVVELAEIKRVSDGQHTPLPTLVATFDAGVTIEDWLRVRPRYANGESYAHPFKQAGMFLALARACLQALQEVHSHGIVHCDVKPDNICLPYAPYPYQREPGHALRIDFERIRLIDFAFSMTPQQPLQHPLPILPSAPYQSNLLKQALLADQASGSRKRLAVEQVDWRADLYSLGHMLGHILEAGLMPPAGINGRAAYDAAYRLVDKLKAYDGGKRPKNGLLPHGGLIAEIDGLLAKLSDLKDYQSFAVDGTVSPTTSVGFHPAPPTPVAAPVAEEEKPWQPGPLPKPPKHPRRWMPWLFAAALLAGAGIGARFLDVGAILPGGKILPQPSAPLGIGDIAKNMVEIPGGEFWMGADDGDTEADGLEKPRRKVSVEDFSLGRYEVTQGQWRAVMGENPSWFAQCGDNCPVEQVSWEDAQRFIKALNEKTGGDYRLPTEAEWEYTCRSGGKAQKYCGGEALDRLAWYSANAKNSTHPVGGKLPNGLGLYDMSGNVLEWTCSIHAIPRDGSEVGCAADNDQNARPVRGGAWLYDSSSSRSTEIQGYAPSLKHRNLGLRLAQAKKIEFEPEMVALPGGRFWMGSRPGDAGAKPDDEPRREVTVRPFSIGKYEVTFREWDACERAGVCPHIKDFWGRGKMPVMNVAWSETQTYIRWLNRRTGKHYRLPTGAEWEYAARAESDTIRFWGDDPDEACRYANVGDQTYRQEKREMPSWEGHHCNDGQAFTAPVGSFLPNQFGLHDMLGNVEERTCSDHMGETFCKNQKAGESLADGNIGNVSKVDIRGGSWDKRPADVRSAAHESVAGTLGLPNLGFRLVEDSATSAAVTAAPPPPPPPQLNCPALNSSETAAFAQTARTLWPKTQGNADAAAVWNKTFGELKADLDRDQPSDDGPRLKARALACLQAMAEAGDGESRRLRQVFRDAFLSQAKDFGNQVANFKVGDSVPKASASVLYDTGFLLWRENAQALAQSGDEEASRTINYINKLGL